jgi:hypothetical protein
MLARVFNTDAIHTWENSVEQNDIGIGDAIMTWNIKDDELSVWHVNDESEFEKVTVAWFANRDKICGTVIAALDDNILTKVKYNNQEGNTIYEEMRKNHRNLVKLDFWSLGYLSENFTLQIMNKKYIFYSEEEIKDFFYSAIKKNKLKITDMKDKLINKLKNDYLQKYGEKLIEDR